MKAQGTCAYATDLVEEIEECVRLGELGEVRSFEGDLRRRLVEETLEEIRSGRIDSFGFEHLLRSLLLGMGAEEARVVPRAQDKGADILATFTVAGAFRFVVALQAKHYQPEPPVGADVVRQLTEGLEAESANLGMVVTSGSFSAGAVAAADAYFDEKGIKIELVDGPQLASLIVERGLRTYLAASSRGAD
jgi:restriction endonuclease Mrr